MGNNPLEFVIENKDDEHFIKFMYKDGNNVYLKIAEVPRGLKIGRHYSITDIYGGTVIDDRRGL